MPNIDDARNADWIRIAGRGKEFSLWTQESVEEACAERYEEYAGSLRALHRHWRHDPTADRNSVFPPEARWVADVIAPDAWHDAWWAAKSSQTLTLTLLAVALRADPTLSWLPFGSELGTARTGLFEVELAESVLNERPFQTQLDFLGLGNQAVVAVEAKYTEKGFGSCRCGQRARGICSARVRERPYWDIARRELGLREATDSCSLSLAYQPVRNLAAARAIAGDRVASFVLLYDSRNPYFSGAGGWPGWVSVLNGLTEHSTVGFESLSWQQLLARLDVSGSLLSWAHDKHGLIPEPA